ncbi:MAG TPA: hypothetical protein VNX66_08880 [Candidatus Sulfotelmatobacter sp.]|nr:hypothetical protein [Candidatus Sulfotelmatobacter sp.]
MIDCDRVSALIYGADGLFGYKGIKYLQKITAVDSLKNVGDGRGSPSPSVGYSWYAGI